MIYKKGDGANPEHYRPICGPQQLSMLCNGLSAVHDRHPSADQAGFRKIFRATDHLMTYKTHISEKQRVENRHVGGSSRLQEAI